MSENCTHDCSSCGESCGERDPKSFIEKPNELSKVKKVIGIVSGKGGVGKSFVTANLASFTQKKGLQAAVLDADITGPSIPKMFGVHEKAMAIDTGILPAVAKNGTQLMSINLLLEDENAPVVWRGPVIAGAVKQFWTDVIWSDVDVLFVDMPPGTGDVPLTVFQSLPVDGIVVVTSPQDLVSMVVSKAVKMAELMNIPILGLVENMAYFECPDCGKKHEIFGTSQLQELAKGFNIDCISRIPINPEYARKCDAGAVYEIEGEFLNEVLDKILE